MSETTANPQLAALMEEASMSRKGLAQRVRTLSQHYKDKPPVSPDHNRVRRWVVDGEVPKQATQQYIAQALSAKLGRKLTLENVGFSAGTDQDEQPNLAEEGSQYPPEIGRSIHVLGRVVEADHRGDELDPSGDEPASSIITNYLFSQQLTVVTGVEATGNRGIAAPIRDTTASFMKLDFQYGGGHLRNLLRSFFRETVVPKLREEHPEAERRDLFSAAAEVSQLLGWTSYDAGLHDWARMYFIQGLRLTREADDRMLGGRLLSNLSHQANYLGKYNNALQYARAAHHAVMGVATPSVDALLLAMEARALANLGEASACAEVMDRAETSLSRRRPGSEPGWVSYVDEAEIGGEWAHCFRDLRQNDQALRFAEHAINGVPSRTQAFMRMVGAKATFQDGNLDEAVSMAHQAVDLAGPLDSARYHQYLVDFHTTISGKYPRDPRIEEFTNTVRERYPSLMLVGDR